MTLETTKPEKIFILLSRFPYPLDKGDKLRAFYFIKHLCSHYSVFLCALSDVDVSEEELSALMPYCVEIQVLRIHKPSILINLALGIFNGLPFQVNYFQNREHQKTIKSIVERIKPNTVFIQLARVAEYVRGFKEIEKVIDYQDCFSKIMQSRADSARWPLSMIFKTEAARMRRYEKEIFPDFQKQLIISNADLDALDISAEQRKHMKVSPNGVDRDYYKPEEIVQHDSDSSSLEYAVFFAGNMNYPPNIEASVFLVEKVMPLVWKVIPNARVLLVGTEPHRRVKDLESSRVTVTGWVEDMRPWFRKSNLLVAPMFIGAGLQNKLLQAMAMRIPCITTPLANSALGAKENTEVMVGANEEELSAHIISLIQHPERAKQIAEGGYRYIQHKFSWEAAVEGI